MPITIFKSTMCHHGSFNIRNSRSIKNYNLPIWFKYAKLHRKKYKPNIYYSHIYVKYNKMNKKLFSRIEKYYSSN